MESLPDEILTHILSLLSPFPTAGVCRLWRGIFAELAEKMHISGAHGYAHTDALRASAFTLIIASTYGRFDAEVPSGQEEAKNVANPSEATTAHGGDCGRAEHAEAADTAWILNGAAFMCASSGPLNACNIAMALGARVLSPVSEDMMKFWLRECLRVWEPPRLHSGAPAEAVLALARVISVAQLERFICFMSGYDGHSLWDEHDTLVNELLLQLVSRPAPPEHEFSVLTLAVAVRFGMHELPYFAAARELYERGEVGLLYNASLFLICQNGLKRAGMKHRSLIFHLNAAGEAVAPTGERLCDCIRAKKQRTMEHIRDATGHAVKETDIGLSSINCHHPCVIRVDPVYYVRKATLTISDNFEQFDGGLRIRILAS